MKDKNQHFLDNLELCVIDLEATGGVCGKDEIIEVGLVHIDNMQVTKTLEFKIKPKGNIPKFVQKLTGLTPEKLKNAPAIEEVMDQIIDFIGDRFIVAHNIAFDLPFLNDSLKRCKKQPLKNHSICTHVMTKYLIPESVSSNLTYLASIFGIELKAHRALEDAKATAKLLLKYFEIFKSKGIKKLNHIYYPQNKFELDTWHFSNEDGFENLKIKLAAIPLTCYLVVKDEKGSMLACLIKTKSNQEKILEILEQMEWHRITLYITGTFFEALRRFNIHLNKMPHEAKDKSLSLLKQIDIQGEASEVDKEYILIPHLISGQYTLYNLQDLHQNKRLILKIPGHEKKLLHFLRTSMKKRNKKFKGSIKIDVELEDSFNSEIDYLKKSNAFLFNFEDTKKDGFIDLLEEKLHQHHQLFDFPDKLI